MSGLPRPIKRSAPVICVICALTCLPAAAFSWAMASHNGDGPPLHYWTARRSVVGALCGRGSTDLRELLRLCERSRADFRSLARHSDRLNATLRGGVGRRVENQQFLAARRSLLRYASGRGDDDPPA